MMVNKRVRNEVLGWNLTKDKMICAHFQDKPFNITVIQLYTLTSNAKEAEVKWFNEDLQDLLELTSKKKKKIIFIIGDWNAKVVTQQISGVKKLTLVYRMKQGKG